MRRRGGWPLHTVCVPVWPPCGTAPSACPGKQRWRCWSGGKADACERLLSEPTSRCRDRLDSLRKRISAMQHALTPEDIAFRDELRRWLDAHLRHAADAHERHRRLVEGRWVVPAWPVRWGGRACSLTQEIIFNQEMGGRDAPVPRNSIALFNIGPMLLAAGTPEQHARYLPKMVTAEEIWCQGFSEPNAGSDLAALEARAEDRGDHWLVNGQKTWNTFGNEALFCLALVRTDRHAPKHKGISALIIDLRQPGVAVRPLREITGDDGFNEIFFSDVRVPKTHLVGPLHAGWKVAMSTLTFERLGTMKLGIQLARRLDNVVQLAKDIGRSAEPLVRQSAAA